MTTNSLNDISNMASESSPLEKSVNDECRLCFSDTKSDFLNLFQSWAEPWEDMASTIAEDLYRLANIHVTELDIHSKVICCKCYIKLREACQFVRCIQKNNSMLKHKLISNDFKINNVSSEQWPQPIEVTKNVNDVINCQNIDIEVKKEVVTEEEENVNNGYPELDIKIEPEEFQEQDRRVVKVKHGEIGELSDTDNRYLEPEFLDNTLKEHASTDNTESELVESLNECMLCCKSFKTISGLKAHVISQHSYKTVKRKPSTDNLLTPERKKRSHVCEICRRSFLTSTDLMLHKKCHNTTTCSNRKFNSSMVPSKHMRTYTRNRDSNKLVSLGSALSRTSVKSANGIKEINIMNQKNSTTNKNKGFKAVL